MCWDEWENVSDFETITQKRHLNLHVLSCMVLSSQRMSFIRKSSVRSLPQYIVTQQSSWKNNIMNHSKDLQRSSRNFQVMLTSLSFFTGFDLWRFSQKNITSSLATIRPGAETGRHRFMVGWGSQGFPRLESEKRIEKQSFPEGSLSFFRCDWKIMKNGLWCRSFQSNMRVLTPW